MLVLDKRTNLVKIDSKYLPYRECHSSKLQFGSAGNPYTYFAIHVQYLVQETIHLSKLSLQQEFLHERDLSDLES